MEAYSKTVGEVSDFFDTSEEGLSSEEVQKKRAKYGPNELEQEDEISKLEILIEQFKSYLVLVLVIATVISAFLGEWVDAIAILIILVLNAILGFVQEYKAEEAINELKKMAAPKATVMRDGEPTEVESKEVVPGDVIILSSGDKIPADARVFESNNLETQEAALTGESVPVKKHTDVLEEDDVGVGDQHNMVFSSTAVTQGKGKAIVTATGMHTEVGKIADMIQDSESDMTPLQEKLDVLGERLGILTLIISAIVFGIGILSGHSYLEMFIVSVSLAVAAIPEGLPAVITISLSFGVPW